MLHLRGHSVGALILSPNLCAFVLRMGHPVTFGGRKGRGFSGILSGYGTWSVGRLEYRDPVVLRWTVGLERRGACGAE